MVLTDHDPHSASSCFQVGEGSVEEVDDGVAHSNKFILNCILMKMGCQVKHNNVLFKLGGNFY